MNNTYQHGMYAQFTVHDSKKREIAVAPVRDRVVHRLVYDFLVPHWDGHFIYDAWSCRKNKGQHKAIARAARYMEQYRRGWVWRADIIKFFDSVDQAVLIAVIKRRITCPVALRLIGDILASYHKHEIGRGMPIGNLTSQIFANIYMNEFDRFMVHTLQPGAYLRYGDDWLCFASTREEVEAIRLRAIDFLADALKLNLSQKLDIVSPVYGGVTYLGIDLWPQGKRITKATHRRIKQKIKPDSFASYEGLIAKMSGQRSLRRFYWDTIDLD